MQSGAEYWYSENCAVLFRSTKNTNKKLVGGGQTPPEISKYSKKVFVLSTNAHKISSGSA